MRNNSFVYILLLIMDYELIKRLAQQKKNIGSVKKLAELIEMTEQGLHKAIRNESLTVKKMELIADLLGLQLVLQPVGNIAAEPDTAYKLKEDTPQEAKDIIRELNGKIAKLQERILVLAEKVEASNNKK